MWWTVVHQNSQNLAFSVQKSTPAWKSTLSKVVAVVIIWAMELWVLQIHPFYFVYFSWTFFPVWAVWRENMSLDSGVSEVTPSLKSWMTFFSIAGRLTTLWCRHWRSPWWHEWFWGRGAGSCLGRLMRAEATWGIWWSSWCWWCMAINYIVLQ